MFIKRIRLSHYCQHDGLDAQISGNLIAVVGRNGTGKSNLLGALQFGFTGSIPDVDKSALLQDGAAEGEVSIDFEHNGVPCFISRRLDKPEAELTAAGQSTSGVKAVNAAIAELLGLDNDIARHSVFVRQAELNDIIFTEPAVRERAWQSMVGLGQAAKVHIQLGECLARIPAWKDYAPLIAETTEELQAELRNYRGLSTRRGKALAELKLIPEPSVAAVSDLHALVAAGERQEEQHRLLAGANSVLAGHVQVSAALDFRLASSAPCDVELSSTQVKLSESANMLKDVELYNRMSAMANDLSARLAASETTLTDGDTADELLRQMAKAGEIIAKHEGTLQVNIGLRDAMRAIPEPGNMVVCPVCDSALRDPSLALARLDDKVCRLAPAIGDMRVVLGELNSKLLIRQAEEETTASLRRERDMYGAKLVDLAARVELGVTVESVRKLELKLAALRAKNAEHADLVNQSAVARARLAELKENGSALTKSADASSMVLEDLRRRTGIGPDQARTRLTELNAAGKACAAARAALATADSALAASRALARRLVTTLRKLRREDASQDGLRKLRKTAESVRNWFHFSQGPRMVVVDILDQLTPDVNSLLSKFGSPYTVVPDYDNILFKYVKGTGASAAPQSVLRLSGGERVMLATSFRIASYCMFASKLGLLTLDEPTVYLDSQNVQLFSHLVEKLRDITAAMKIQLFMSTHEESIIPLCDTVINLNSQTT